MPAGKTTLLVLMVLLLLLLQILGRSWRLVVVVAVVLVTVVGVFTMSITSPLLTLLGKLFSPAPIGTSGAGGRSR